MRKKFSILCKAFRSLLGSWRVLVTTVEAFDPKAADLPLSQGRNLVHSISCRVQNCYRPCLGLPPLAFFLLETWALEDEASLESKLRVLIFPLSIAIEIVFYEPPQIKYIVLTVTKKIVTDSVS